MSPSAVPPQRNRVVTSNCSEGPDCPSRAHRRTPDPGPIPPGGTPRCLTFTLADQRRSGRAHPHLQVSAENAEETDLYSRGRARAERGGTGWSYACALGPHVAGDASRTHCAGAAYGRGGRSLVSLNSGAEQREDGPADADSYFCEPGRRLF
ncbi:hypothetical protein NN561_013553 [Cricetulus griseus]